MDRCLQEEIQQTVQDYSNIDNYIVCLYCNYHTQIYRLTGEKTNEIYCRLKDEITKQCEE